MSKVAWHQKLESIQFYIITFRRLSLFLVISFIVNIILGGIIYYKYFHQNKRDYYATNGIVSPIKLEARNEPNYSSKAILTTPEAIAKADKPIPE